MIAEVVVAVVAIVAGILFTIGLMKSITPPPAVASAKPAPPPAPFSAWDAEDEMQLPMESEYDLWND